MVERLLYVELSRRVVGVLDEQQAAIYQNIRVCGGGQRCNIVFHADLTLGQDVEQLGHAYLALEDAIPIGVDKILAAKHGRIGQVADLSCAVTCEGCYHSNEATFFFQTRIPI